MELRLDTTRSDDLNDLEERSMSAAVSTLSNVGTGPKDQVLAKSSYYKTGRTWAQRPRGQDGDQETLQCKYIYYAEQ